MNEIDIRELSRGINARRGNVSITSPSSVAASQLIPSGAFYYYYLGF